MNFSELNKRIINNGRAALAFKERVPRVVQVHEFFADRMKRVLKNIALSRRFPGTFKLQRLSL